MSQNVFVARTITQDAFGGLISPRDFVDLVINEKTDDYFATNGERKIRRHLVGVIPA